MDRDRLARAAVERLASGRALGIDDALAHAARSLGLDRRADLPTRRELRAHAQAFEESQVGPEGRRRRIADALDEVVAVLRLLEQLRDRGNLRTREDLPPREGLRTREDSSSPEQQGVPEQNRNLADLGNLEHLGNPEDLGNIEKLGTLAQSRGLADLQRPARIAGPRDSRGIDALHDVDARRGAVDLSPPAVYGRAARAELDLDPVAHVRVTSPLAPGRIAAFLEAAGHDGVDCGSIETRYGRMDELRFDGARIAFRIVRVPPRMAVDADSDLVTGRRVDHAGREELERRRDLLRSAKE